jgi:hypothetical protein
MELGGLSTRLEHLQGGVFTKKDIYKEGDSQEKILGRRKEGYLQEMIPVRKNPARKDIHKEEYPEVLERCLLEAFDS